MLKNNPFFIVLFSWFAMTNVHANNLTNFGQNRVDDWQTKAFVGETQYRLVKQNNQTILKAHSEASASGIIFEEKIDLLTTPYINWRWRIENKLSGIDETSKEGDDFVARVYVVLDGGMFFWQTKALTYVWSSNQASGTSWDNAYAGEAVKMLAVRGNDAQVNQWFDEKHHVYLDLIQYFGDQGSDSANRKKYRYIDATVIMTDTDNSGGVATAYYSDIIFSNH
jgi:hypothetical protein